MAEQSSVLYSGSTRRFCAFVIDGMILALVVGILVNLLINDLAAQQAIARVVAALYFILLESSGRMASLGKSAMKIYVAMDEGKKAPVLTMALRYLILMIPSVPLFFFFYSSDYFTVMQNIQQYSEANDMQGVTRYLQGPEVKETLIRMSKFGCVTGALGIALFWLPIVFTREKTGLHDYLTKTRVFRRNPEFA
jgi:uncharacterized RDD family membrane protein YckC